MSNNTTGYLDYILAALQDIHENQQDKIEAAAARMVETFLGGGSLFVFGPGHAGIFTQDMYQRVGGLIFTNPILHPGTLVSNQPISTTSALEKLPGSGVLVLDSARAKAGDMLIIHSVAGRIPIVTEMAQEARRRGIYVMGITNLKFARGLTSLAPDGKMLYEVCDLVMDERGEFGDVCVSVDGMRQKVGATSTITSSFIGHLLEIRVCELLLERGIVPPVIESTNVDGGDAHNARLMEQYKDRIHYL